MGLFDRRRKQRPIRLRIPAGTRQLIGVPVEAPSQALISALVDACSVFSEIDAAYLFQTAFADRDDQPRLAVGLLLSETVDEHSFGVIVPVIAGRVNALVEGDLTFQLLSDETLQAVRAAVEPIYDRAPHG